MVVVDEMALLDLVVSHLHAPAQLRQNHHLYIIVFQPDGQVVLVYLLVTHALDDGVRIDNAARTLIDTFLQEHWSLLRLSNLIGRNGHYFSPSFDHSCILLLCSYKDSVSSYFFSTNSFSSSSRLFPLVSGQLRNRKMKAHRQMTL